MAKNHKNQREIIIVNQQQHSHSEARSWIVTLLLCLFFGFLGVHRFYAGKIGTGVLYLFTGGLFVIGAVVDFFMILTKTFRDKEGRIIR
jgi:TM2 domain-containing membrane protein YozV